MSRAASIVLLALLVLLSCHKDEAHAAKGSDSSKPFKVGDYSVQALPSWKDATSELRNTMETQDEAVNASLSLRSSYQRAFRVSEVEVYIFSIVDKDRVALGSNMIDSYLNELSEKFGKNAPNSKPQSNSTETTDGRIWSWRAVISGQLYYKTIYWNRSNYKAVEVDLITNESAAAESLKRYTILCGSLQ